jgi:hypothetical protein
MKATTQYLKKLLEQNRRDSRVDKHQLRQTQDFDFENYVHEPPEMPDWAKAIREHNNNIRTVHLP